MLLQILRALYTGLGMLSKQQEQLNRIEGAIKQMGSNVNTLQTEEAALAAGEAQIETNEATMEAQLTAEAAQIATLKATAANNPTDIAALQAVVDAQTKLIAKQTAALGTATPPVTGAAPTA